MQHAVSQRLQTNGVVIASKRQLQLKLALVQNRIKAATDSAVNVGDIARLVLEAATNETVESRKVSTVDAISELIDDLGQAKVAVKSFQQLAEDQVAQLGTRKQQRQPIANIQVWLLALLLGDTVGPPQYADLASHCNQFTSNACLS